MPYSHPNLYVFRFFVAIISTETFLNNVRQVECLASCTMCKEDGYATSIPNPVTDEFLSTSLRAKA